MFRWLIPFLLILTSLLYGCKGSEATSTVTTSYVFNNGDKVEVTKSATVKSKSDTTNPPTVDLDNITLVPFVLGTEIYTDPFTNIKVETPILGVNVNTGNASSTGNFLSNVEAALPLLKTPMIIGSILLAAGIIIFFIPFPPVLKRLSIRAGIGITVAGLILMGASWFFASQFGWLLWIIGALILLSLIGFGVYLLIKYGRVAHESVQTTEYLKKKVLTPEQKSSYFDGKDAPVSLIQSDSTKNIIKQVRTIEGFKQ